MKSQEANHLVHCSCTSYGSIVYRKVSSSKILMNFQWNPSKEYIVYQFDSSSKESKSQKVRGERATQVYMKYTRETPTKKKKKEEQENHES
jgi:hypothetical protein